ncbi:Anaphase-promoting complex subunit 8 [Vitis vinifera]|uniref:Anaphase-promoting complex subunit 8 n=1 Tax=Vitis vinifera TaxID=29760 RepID=A0A438KJ78_VITVI|nr:Anaphase-promoting complex subunit 8 [Vitis vinifera]
MSSKDSCRNELRFAIRQLSDRCLYSAAKWAAEQLVGIEQDPAKFTPSHTRFQRGSSSIRRRFRTNEIASTPTAGVSYVSTPVLEEDEAVDGDFYLLAKSYFDCREYRRTAHVLRDQTGKKAVFLRCYALYLGLGWGKGKFQVQFHVTEKRKRCQMNPISQLVYGLQTQEKRGLGLRNLSVLNSAFLDKWVWRFASEREPPWKQVIIVKFGKKGDVGAPVCKGRLWCRIKEGNKCDNSPLRASFPFLYAIASSKDLWVADA